jgi:hypothetical protein
MRGKSEAETVAVRSGAMTAENTTKIETLRAEFIHRWNERWVVSEKGRWTAQWFPTVQARLRRPWVVPDHYTSQFLSGHGDFGEYLSRFAFRDDAHCEDCGHETDSVTHVLFECPSFSQERLNLRLKVGTVTANWPCEVEEMTQSERIYKKFETFCKERS